MGCELALAPLTPNRKGQSGNTLTKGTSVRKACGPSRSLTSTTDEQRSPINLMVLVVWKHCSWPATLNHGYASGQRDQTKHPGRLSHTHLEARRSGDSAGAGNEQTPTTSTKPRI
jgi:hypothetical protein